jgi:trans-2,3-dihydro-3-hydroxyanthranilate isomerase
MARFRYVIADVFTDTPLQGNQLAVFTDARDIPEHQLQAIAREMNLSETVFCYPAGYGRLDATQQQPRDETAQQGGSDRESDYETVFVSLPESDGHVKIRIFTPEHELPFAGHPILGSAFVLGGPLQLMEIRLETGSGVVPVVLEREGARIVFGRMRQPIPTWRPYEREPELLAALGVDGSELPVEVYDLGPTHVYVALRDEAAVAALTPDLKALATLDVGANCFAGSGTRWKTRMFAPSYGVDEDPATGSAAGPLAVHLARHGRIDYGEEIEISQGAELNRPSTLFARVEGEGDRIEAVEVGGSAVIVARGEFRL